MAAVGSGVDTLLNGGGVYFSPDGNNIGGGGSTSPAYTGTQHIVEMTAAANGVETLFSGGGVYFSPDGKNLGGGGNTLLTYFGTQKVLSVQPFKNGVLTLFGGSGLYLSPDGSYLGGGGSTILVNTGVSSFQVAPTGRVYALKSNGAFTFSDDGRNYSRIDSGIKAFAITTAGRVYALKTSTGSSTGLVEASDDGRAGSYSTAATGVSSLYTGSDGTVYAALPSGGAFALPTGGALASLLVSGPSAVTAGTPFTITIIAKGASGNTITTDNRTISVFTGTSSQNGGTVSLPTTITLSSGIGTVAATLFTAGSATFSATAGTIRATSNTITVNPADVTSVLLSAPTTVTAGAGFDVTVTGEDKYGNGCNVPSTLLSSDGQVPPTPLTLVNGTASAVITFAKAGSTTLTATAGTITSSWPITIDLAVSPAALLSATAGQSYSATMSATGGLGQYAYSVVSGTLPMGLMLSSAGVVSGMTTIAGSYTFILQATDISQPGVMGSQACTLTVNPAAAASLVVTSSTTAATAGTIFGVQVTAEDVYGNTATGYSSSVTLTSSDGQPFWKPADLGPPGGPVAPISPIVTLAQGFGEINIVLIRADTITLTGIGPMQGGSGSILGTSKAIVVSPAGPASIVLSAPSTATDGDPFQVTLTVTDAYGNDCSGAATLGSSDGGSWDVTVTNGTGRASATLNIPHKVTLIARMGTASSGYWTITVQPGQAFELSASATNPTPSVGQSTTITIYALDACGYVATSFNGTVTMTISNSGAFGFSSPQMGLNAGKGTITLTAQHSDQRLGISGVTLTVTGTNASGAPMTPSTSRITIIPSFYTWAYSCSLPATDPSGKDVTLTNPPWSASGTVLDNNSLAAQTDASVIVNNDISAWEQELENEGYILGILLGGNIVVAPGD
jgi:hypothetical protein